jgi:transcriptional regulator with XRE-family HTH domain
MDRKEDVLRAFGRQIAALRAQKQLSINELATAAGLEPARVIKIEAGQVNLLFTTILALAHALEVSPGELLRSI